MVLYSELKTIIHESAFTLQCYPVTFSSCRICHQFRMLLRKMLDIKGPSRRIIQFWFDLTEIQHKNVGELTDLTH